MKIFLSWSGDRSNRVASLFEWWIKCVLQNTRPWMSDTGIDRGALWFNAISDQLSDVKVGVIFLAKDNLTKPWILFEAGAIAKGIKENRVCTFLIDLQPNDVQAPLSHFNHTLPNSQSLYALVSTINSALGDFQLTSETLRTVFDTYWPQFEKTFAEILSTTTEGAIPKRDEGEILSEILSAVRGLDQRQTNESRDRAVKHVGSFRNHNITIPFATTQTQRDLLIRVARAEISKDEFIAQMGRVGVLEPFANEMFDEVIKMNMYIPRD